MKTTSRLPRRLCGGLVAAAMLALPATASAQSSLDAESSTPPAPLVQYDFNDLSKGADKVTNSGTGGEAYNGVVENHEALQVGQRDNGGATASFPGGAKGSTESDMPYISVPNGVLKNAEGFTVSMWMNWDGKNGDDAKASPWAYYIGGDKLKKNTTGAFLTPSEGGKLTATSDNADTGKQTKAITGAPEAGVWQYVTLTQDADTMTLYVNGEKKGSAQAAQNLDKLHNDASTFSALIGRTAFTERYAPYFGGQIDDFAIWNTALSADQVTALFGNSSTEDKGEPQSVAPIAQQITQGQTPALPGTVQVTYSSGASVAHKVTWQDHDWANQGVGEVTIEGVVEGVPDSIKATLTVNVVARNAEKVVVSQVKQNGTKGYLEVDGQPYYFSGLQNMSEWSRYGNDWKLTYTDPTNKTGASGPYLNNNWDNPILDESWSENLFEKTKAAGFNTIQFMFSWKNIEPGEKGVYDWSVLDRYIQWAQKYDLRINFIWFGTNTQGGGVMQNTEPGHGFMATVPEWAEAKNEDGSFKYFTSRRSGVEKYYVRTPNDKDPASAAAATELFEAECAAVHAMFNHLAEVDTTHRTILFNVWNEPDSASGFTTFGAAHDMWMDLARNMVNAIKTSNYQVATAMNFHRSYWQNDNFKKALLDFANVVDFVGPDSYDTNLENQAKWITSAVEGHANKMGWMPEAGGNAGNKTGLVAEALAAGGTVSFWELNNALLDSSKNFPFYGSTEDGYPLYTEWKLGEIPEMPVSGQKMASFNTALNKMNALIAKSEKQNVGAFNSGIETPRKTNPATKYSVEKTVGDAKVTFTTSNGSVGLAIYNPDNKQVYVATDSLKDAQTFNIGTGVVASVGAFDASGRWVQTEARQVADNGDVLVKPGELVRIGEEIAVDKTQLGELVGEATQMEEAAYTQESWETFEQAFKTANAVNLDSKATQEQVNAAYDALKKAMDGLIAREATALKVTKVPDKTEYTLGEQFDATGMVVTITNNDGSTIELTGGYGMSGYDASKVGAQTITVSYGEGEKALSDTFEVTVSAPIEVSGLQAMVDAASEVKESDYAPQTWASFAKALAEAQQTLKEAGKTSGGAGVSQRQINDAQVALFRAAVGLEKVTPSGGQDGSGDDTGGNQPGGGDQPGDDGQPDDGNGGGDNQPGDDNQPGGDGQPDDGDDGNQSGGDDQPGDGDGSGDHQPGGDSKPDDGSGDNQPGNDSDDDSGSGGDASDGDDSGDDNGATGDAGDKDDTDDGHDSQPDTGSGDAGESDDVDGSESGPDALTDDGEKPSELGKTGGAVIPILAAVIALAVTGVVASSISRRSRRG